MKIPTTAMYDNLRFTSSGQVWADFLLTGVNYGLRAPDEKERVRLLHQALFRALPGESLMLGLCSTLDPHQVVDKMLNGLDPQLCPDWVAECEATLDTIESLRPGYRVFWLSVPLSNDGTSVSSTFKAARSNIESALGLPVAKPSDQAIKTAAAKAKQVADAIPALFKPTPATPAQMVWLHQHMIDRGLYLDPLLPQRKSITGLPKGRSALGAPLLDEGGRTDDEKKTTFNPLKRRYLKVQSPAPGDEDAASYQSMLVVSDVPDGELPFPGGEMLGRLDECGLSVDWAMRLTVRSSSEVLRSNQRALETLNEQFNQREGELSHGVSALDRHASDLSEYAALMESNKLEVECQATFILNVAAADPDDVRAQAAALAGWYSEAGYKLAQPVGYQQELWWQCHPGVPTSSLTREYAQLTTSEALSVMVPLSTAHVGDQAGTLLAININNGPMLDEFTPCGSSPLIFHDPDGSTDRNVSGSTAYIGDLGSGKSFALKKEAGAILDRGGRVIVTDRTNMGEWAVWADALADPRIVDVSEPQWSLDPLRIFTPATGSRVAQSFLTPLLDIAPTSAQGVLLSEVLEVDYLKTHGITGFGSLVDHLADTCTIPGAGELARLIKVFSRKDLGRVVFDEELPALNLNHPIIVVRTHQLALPKRSELDHEHLFRQMGIEKLFGRALFALITSIAKHECFANRDQLAAFVVDEAHAVTSSTEGTNELVDFIRDGRKHRAVVYLGSHDPDEDFPSETMRGLIPFRVLMRHKDKTLAQNGLRWLDLDHTDPSLIDLVTKDTSPELGGEVPVHRRGECLIRDASGAVGRGRILPPALKSRDQAARTGGQKDRAA